MDASLTASEDSDIAAHLPKLRELAGQCRHVTEFGTRTGVSTAALLAGQPAVLVTYDLKRWPDIALLAEHSGRTQFRYLVADVLTVDIEPTDLLFIDTLHTARQVYAELTRHAEKVRRFLVFHDTATAGEVDAYWPTLPAGLLYGIGRYVWEHPGEWAVIYRSEDCHGLLVMERTP